MLILIGLTLFLRSQNAQISASARQDSAQDLSAAEAGVTLAQSFLDRRRFLADDDSGTATSTTTGWVPDLQTRADTYQAYVGAACPEIAEAKTTAINYLGGSSTPTLLPLANGTGKFRIVNYDYQASPTPAKGVLTVEGTSEQAIDDPNDLISIARVRVEIPLDTNAVPPALWASNFNLATNNLIDGNIKVYACPTGTSSTGSFGTNIVSDANIEPYSGDLKVDPYQRIPDIITFPTTGDGRYTLTSAISGAITLPRVIGSIDEGVDVDGNGIYDNVDYHYEFDGFSGDQITVNTVITIDGTKVSVGRGVNIYLDSNLDLSGVRVQVNGGTVGQRYLRIWGQDDMTTIRIDDTTDLNDPYLMTLIHGPSATATFLNPVTADSVIRGSVWVKSVAAATAPASPKTWVQDCTSCSWGNMAPTIPAPVRLSSASAWTICSRDTDASGMPIDDDWERPNTNTAGGADLACNGS
jgi:hypothetical protein